MQDNRLASCHQSCPSSWTAEEVTPVVSLLLWKVSLPTEILNARIYEYGEWSLNENARKFSRVKIKQSIVNTFGTRFDSD